MVRYKNRYLLLEWKFASAVVGHRTLNGESTRNILGFIRERVRCYHGDYGVACVKHSLNVKYHNVSTMMSIVRCPRAHHTAVRSALTGVTSYKGEPCSITVVHVAGTIQSAQKALLKNNTIVLKLS